MSAQRAATITWLPDDTEEDLVGADWHQRAISSLCNGLSDLAFERGWPWHVGNQLPLDAWRPDNTRWTPSPDIMVHPQAGPEQRDRIDARTEGVPALIVEVAGRTTWRKDVGIAGRGKALEYLSLGVLEYLVFDPTGEYIAERCRAWRLVDGAWQSWQPQPDGRYASGLGISFRPEDLFLRIFDPDGVPVPFDYEKGRQNMALRQENLTLSQEVATLRAELERLRRQNSAAPPVSPAPDDDVNAR